jgi:hypothetical protein
MGRVSYIPGFLSPFYCEEKLALFLRSKAGIMSEIGIYQQFHSLTQSLLGHELLAHDRERHI